MRTTRLRVKIGFTDRPAPACYRVSQDVYRQLLQDLDACLRAGRPRPSRHTYLVWEEDGEVITYATLDLSQVESVRIVK